MLAVPECSARAGGGGREIQDGREPVGRVKTIVVIGSGLDLNLDWPIGEAQMLLWAEAVVWGLWESTRVLKVEGLNPGTVYWMDIFIKCYD